jgi:hypothetical protein
MFTSESPTIRASSRALELTDATHKWQNVWSLFVVYMGVSRFGNIRLGKDNEKPAYSDFAWFSMLFCSGIGIGIDFRVRLAR